MKRVYSIFSFLQGIAKILFLPRKIYGRAADETVATRRTDKKVPAQVAAQFMPHRPGVWPSRGKLLLHQRWIDITGSSTCAGTKLNQQRIKDIGNVS